MKIAIIGGGAAGLVCAHLLDEHHEITLYERESVLGGHVRTLGCNVKAPPSVPYPLDAGVIEFDRVLFPTVARLFARLGIETEAVPATTTFFPVQGPRSFAPGAIARSQLAARERMFAWSRGLKNGLARERFLRRTRLPLDSLYERSVGDVLDDSDFARWLALLTMYAYSTPYPEVREMSAALVVPMLRDFVKAHNWIRVVGGTYRYIAAINAALRGTVVTDARVRRVRRFEPGVEIDFADGSRRMFDAVVFAIPPGDVLPLLEDPSDGEGARFAHWRTRETETVIHEDLGPYARRETDFATEFDVFELGSQRGGYNALLNLLSGVPRHDNRRFGLAFGMDDEIDPSRILHRQRHRVPVYSQRALERREEIISSNGERATWFVGAWLGNGLHEGAVRSAADVAVRLGGDSL